MAVRVCPSRKQRPQEFPQPELRSAILGNVGTIISFRVGAEDADILEMEFAPDVRAVDLVNLPNYQVYVKLMIDGVVSRGFSGETVEY